MILVYTKWRNVKKRARLFLYERKFIATDEKREREEKKEKGNGERS